MREPAGRSERRDIGHGLRAIGGTVLEVVSVGLASWVLSLVMGTALLAPGGGRPLAPAGGSRELILLTIALSLIPPLALGFIYGLVRRRWLSPPHVFLGWFLFMGVYSLLEIGLFRPGRASPEGVMWSVVGWLGSSVLLTLSTLAGAWIRYRGEE